MARLLSWPNGLRWNRWKWLSGPEAVGASAGTTVGDFTQTIATPFGARHVQLSFPSLRGKPARRARGMVTALHKGANAVRVSLCDWDGLPFDEAGVNASQQQKRDGMPWRDSSPANGTVLAQGDFASGVFSRSGASVSAADAFTFTRNSIGTYVDSSGVLQTAAANAPRLDYDPTTGAARGLLVEPFRTNYFTQSGNQSDASYTVTNTVKTANALVAPDGTMTATLLKENTAAGEHGLAKSFTGRLVDVVFWNSVFVKKLPGSAHNFVYFSCNTFAAHKDRTQVVVNLTTGAMTSLAGVNPAAFVEAYPNGWFRVVFRATASGTGNNVCTLRIVADATGAPLSFTGDGSSGVYTWGWQQEEGASYSSYIPTAGAAVTRSADQLSIGSSWFSNWTLTLDAGQTLIANVNGTLAIDPAAISRPHIKSYQAVRVGRRSPPTTSWANGRNWRLTKPNVAVKASVSRGGTIVSLDDAFWGHELGMGDWIGFFPFHFGHYEVTEVIDDGKYRIWPPLRAPLAVGDFATLYPTMAMRLKADNLPDAERGPAFMENLTISLFEVFDYDVRDYFGD